MTLLLGGASLAYAGSLKSTLYISCRVIHEKKLSMLTSPFLFKLSQQVDPSAFDVIKDYMIRCPRGTEVTVNYEFEVDNAANELSKINKLYCPANQSYPVSVNKNKFVCVEICKVVTQKADTHYHLNEDSEAFCKFKENAINILKKNSRQTIMSVEIKY